MVGAKSGGVQSVLTLAEARSKVNKKKGSIAMVRHGERYEEWCSEKGLAAYPVSIDSVAGYLFKFVADNKGSTRSVRNVKSYVKSNCESKGQAWLSNSELRRVTALVRELVILDMSEGARKKALQRKYILQIEAGMDLRDIHAVYLCLLLETGHNGLLRSGELLSGVKVTDLLWRQDKSGFRMLLKWTKAGGPAYINFADFGGVNAVSLMRRWFDANELWEVPEAHVFPVLMRGRKGFDFSKTATQSWLRKWIKVAVASIGLDPRKYSGHSLRAGGATDLFVARTPYYVIKKKGRWISDAAMVYYRDEEDVEAAVSIAFAMWE